MLVCGGDRRDIYIHSTEGRERERARGGRAVCHNSIGSQRGDWNGHPRLKSVASPLGFWSDDLGSKLF